MNRCRTALALAALVSITAAGAAAAAPLLTRVVPDSVAAGAAPVARPEPGRVLSIAVGLKLRDPAGLAVTLRHLTDPHDPAFRHWLGVDEFARRFGPSQADHAAVRAALARAGLIVQAASPSRLVIEARGRVADLERLLHVTFGLYRHPTENRLFLSPDREPSLDLAVPVLAIDGLEDFDLPRPHLVRTAGTTHATGSGPGGQFTAQDVRRAYYGGGPLTGAGQSVGLFELGSYDPADVTAYFTRVHAPSAVPIVPVSLDGIQSVCDGSSPCHDAEQALDIEELASMAPGLKQIVYYGGHVPMSILARMASDDICAVLSVSWGWQPNPKVLEPVLQEMAAQGQTLLVATGDDGYHLAEGVVWPADDGWAIAVGGTDLRTKGPGGPWESEHGWRYSGGGPTPNGIPIPAWQTSFVSAANGASPALRNVPDIAGDANTDNFSCYNGHCNGGNGGTSYAAPLWAGFVALANEQAATAGQPTVGFFIPALYAAYAPGAPYQPLLHDQLRGFNGRYHAQPGFDLVTGLGSPFGALTLDWLSTPR